MEETAQHLPYERTRNNHTYLLHIWRTAAGQPWRITLRQAGVQETQHFSSFTALVSTLWQQLQGKEAEGG